MSESEIIPQPAALGQETPQVDDRQETPQVDNRQELQAQLAQLQAAATKEYSLKNYAAASEHYSQASELQVQLNGEMCLDNADLLYQYGRCLYHLGVTKSDVLGNKVAGNQQDPQKKKPKTKSSTNDAKKDPDQKTAEQVVDEKTSATKDEAPANKPFFQITGDENWTDSEDEDDDAEDAEAEGEDDEDDDFAIAYEILDIARVLLTRKLESLPQQSYTGKGKAKAEPLISNPETRQIMDRLADTHDLQAELSLENENFPEAVSEGRSALDLKLKLYPTESSLLAEAHFKLALAMEFASVTTSEETEGEKKDQQVDEELRKEAAEHMELAIASCRLRVVKEEEAISSLPADQAQAKKREIKDVKEMITDMEQRLTELHTPISLNTGDPAGAPDTDNPLRGVLGAILGETPFDQKARIEEATKNANDLSGLVKKKKAKSAVTACGAAAVNAVNVSGAEKRKSDDDDGHVAQGNKGKKVKFEEEN